MPIQSIVSVWYPVSDWQRAKRFYTEVLGLQIEACDDTAGWIACRAPAGGPPLFLVRKPSTDMKGGAVVSFDVDDVDDLIPQVVAAGERCRPRFKGRGRLDIHHPRSGRQHAGIVPTDDTVTAFDPRQYRRAFIILAIDAGNHRVSCESADVVNRRTCHEPART